MSKYNVGDFWEQHQVACNRKKFCNCTEVIGWVVEVDAETKKKKWAPMYSRYHRDHPFQWTNFNDTSFCPTLEESHGS